MALPMLKRELFSNKSLTVESFMFLNGPVVKNNVYTFNAYPIVNFRYNSFNNVDYIDTKLITFKMSPRNHWKVLNFINNIMKWMIEYKDLFMYNENNELIFNYDYKSLKEIVKSNFSEAQIMKAAPAVLNFNETKVPGICLYINKENHLCQLTNDEISQLFSIIREFNFQDEMIWLTNMYSLYKDGKLPTNTKDHSNNNGNNTSPWGV